MADIFMELSNVPGESEELNFEQQIEVLSYSWGASSPGSFQQGSGGSIGGKAVFSDLSFTGVYEKSSTTLLGKLSRNDHIPTGKLTILKRGTETIEAIKYEFEDIKINAWQVSGSEGSNSHISASITFAKITVTYKVQANSGQSDGIVSEILNIQKGDFG